MKVTISKPRLAVIEDHDDLREEMLIFLSAQGFSCWGAASAEDFYKKLHSQTAEIVLADIMLPGESGLEVIDYLRKNTNMGIIAITARSEREDRLAGMSSGADYYLCKPVDLEELLLILENLWQRIANDCLPLTTGKTFWRINFSTGELSSPHGQSIFLSDQESGLLKILLGDANTVYSKETLHAALYPEESKTDTHRIDVIVNRIRKKAKEADLQLPLRAVFGKGLVFKC